MLLVRTCVTVSVEIPPSANILLSEDWRGRLGDFGLARALPSSAQLQHSSVLTTTIVGTPLYMAPEAIGGAITRAADVYAFGVVSARGKCGVVWPPIKGTPSRNKHSGTSRYM